MQNILKALESLRKDAENTIQETLSVLPNQEKTQQLLDLLPQFTGLKSIEKSAIENHPLYKLYEIFNDSELAASKSFSLSNLFGVTEKCNLEFTNPKIHPNLKSFMIFEAFMNGNKGYLVTNYNSNKIEIQNSRARENNEPYSSDRYIIVENLEGVFFISGFSIVDLKNANIFEDLNLTAKEMFDRF